MRLNHFIIKRLVLGFQGSHEGVFADGCGLLGVLLVGALDLHFEGLGAGGEEGIQGEGGALGGGKGGAFV